MQLFFLMPGVLGVPMMLNAHQTPSMGCIVATRVIYHTSLISFGLSWNLDLFLSHIIP